MKKQVSASNAPAAIGPYSQAIEVNGTLYISGQIPINPDTGTLNGTTVDEQTHQVLKNLEAVLTQAGLTKEDVVKTTIYMQDLSGFDVVNNIYGDFFHNTVYPARACVQVAKLPKGALIEIEAIAER